MSHQTGTQYPLADCFQIAIASLSDILKRYSPNHGASLKTYASLVFGNTIRDSLRQQHEADIRTDWGLLRKLSQKRLVESLQQTGLSADAIASYVLAWTCFKTLWTSGDAPATRRLSRPDQATWDAIAQLYNRQRPHQLSPTAPQGTPETLERWLLSCAKYVRAYLYPATTSLNLSKSESGAGELQDDLPDRAGASPLTDLITQEELQERQTQQAQINEVLTTALTTLNPQIQTLLTLYYGQQLTQQQIAVQLDIKQYTVSRRLSSAKESLLLKLAQWSQETLHISLTSTAVSHMSVVLEEWLEEKGRLKIED